MKGNSSKPRTDDQCGMWAYVDGETWVCSKPDNLPHEWHHDADNDREWTRGQVR